MPCPNCGRLILFEEQFDALAADFSGSILDRDLDFNTKEPTLSDRFSRIPRWYRFGSVLIPLLVALAFLAPDALARLGFSSSWFKPAVVESPKRAFKSVPMDWSKIREWTTNIDILEGSFAGYSIAREIMKQAPASQYEELERLFDYDSILSQIADRKGKSQDPVVDSFDLIESKVSESVRSFLSDSESITPGYHDWRVVGIATQENQTAMLMRYYRESETVADMLDDEELLLPLTKLVDFNNFKLYCDNIFRTKHVERVSNPKLLGYMYANFYADKHFGYLALVLSGKGADAQIQDGFDFQIKRPLSQFCLIWSGASNLNTNEIPFGTMQLPGPSDSDIRTVQTWLKNRNDSSWKFDPASIRSKLESIYDQTKDPLMQDLLGRLESQLGNQQQALEYFRKSKSARFQSLDSHRAFIQEAIQAQDSNLLIERLHELNNYWDIKLTGSDAEEDRKKYYKFQRYWRTGDRL
jgi:hypothetical protein